MSKIFEKGYAFDDVLIKPLYSEVVPRSISTRTKLTDEIWLNIPMISAAMDTVTRAPLAIAIAREGGLGIINKNMSIEEQAAEVNLVKRAEDGLILDPLTLKGTNTVLEALNLMEERKIGGIPIIDDAKKPIGIVTRRDLRYYKKKEDQAKELTEVMVKDLVTGQKGISIKKAQAMMEERKVARLIILDEEGKLHGLITYSESSKTKEYELALKDKNGQLIVGAAVGATEDVLERVRALVEAGVDIVCLDSAHGDSKNVHDAIKKIKAEFKNLPVIAGNVATKAGALGLQKAGADVVKVGIGPGSICTTRIVAGIGVPQLTAIIDVCDALNNTGVTVIADGGIRYSGDLAKAIAAGANCIMAGSIFAGTDEAPGETIFSEGRKYKSYRGMGSLGAMKDGSKDRYAQGGVDNKKLVPEGVEAVVPYKGALSEVIHQFIGGLKQSMGYCGAKDITTFQQDTSFVEITSSGIIESHPHDVIITKEAPNYSR